MSGVSTTLEWKTRVQDLDELAELGRRLAPLVQPPATVIFLGPLGSGKTSLIQSILRAMGVVEHVKSPTFDLVHRYAVGTGWAIHVDLYRLAVPPPPEELDADDPEALVLVEWGDPWRPYYPDRFEVRLEVEPRGDGRWVTLSAVGRMQEPLQRWGGRGR